MHAPAKTLHYLRESNTSQNIYQNKIHFHRLLKCTFQSHCVKCYIQNVSLLCIAAHRPLCLQALVPSCGLLTYYKMYTSHILAPFQHSHLQYLQVVNCKSADIYQMLINKNIWLHIYNNTYSLSMAQSS